MSRSAFAVHPFDRDDLVRADPWFGRYSPGVLERVSPLLEPFYYGAVSARSCRGELAAEVFALPLLPDQVLALRPTVLEQLCTVARMGRAMGARVLGLGALLGAVAARSDEIEAVAPGLRVTSGNALTAAVIQAALERGATHGLPGSAARETTVVGASGSLGRLTSLRLARAGWQLTLVGRQQARLSALQQELQDRFGATAQISTDLDAAVRGAAVVLLAISTAAPLSAGTPFAPGALVVDASEPPSLCARLWAQRPDLSLFSGLFLRPAQLSLGCDLHLPAGRLYPCLAETLLLGELGAGARTWAGHAIDLETSDWIWERAGEHGLELELRQAPPTARAPARDGDVGAPAPPPVVVA